MAIFEKGQMLAFHSVKVLFFRRIFISVLQDRILHIHEVAVSNKNLLQLSKKHITFPWQVRERWVAELWKT